MSPFKMAQTIRRGRGTR